MSAEWKSAAAGSAERGWDGVEPPTSVRSWVGVADHRDRQRRGLPSERVLVSVSEPTEDAPTKAGIPCITPENRL